MMVNLFGKFIKYGDDFYEIKQIGEMCRDFIFLLTSPTF
jgi:hypothetical protein